MNALVTGGNRGIGLAIVKKLTKQIDARTLAAAQRAANKFADAANVGYFNEVKGVELNLDSPQSIDSLADQFLKKSISFDIIIHNAGMAYKVDDPTPFESQVHSTLQSNYYGTLRLCKVLEPLLKRHARIVIVSSRAGLYHIIQNRELRKKCSREAIKTIDDVNKLIEMFVESVKIGNFEQLGFPRSAYGMSKLGLTLAAFAMQNKFSERPKDDIIINACCPGYVRTDMTGQKGNLSPDEGADTPVYLALLPKNIAQPKGQFVCERKSVEWC